MQERKWHYGRFPVDIQAMQHSIEFVIALCEVNMLVFSNILTGKCEVQPLFGFIT